VISSLAGIYNSQFGPCGFNVFCPNFGLVMVAFFLNMAEKSSSCSSYWGWFYLA
jgi:hypothetical protein